MSDATRNERVKLTAGIINNLATAFAVAGVIAPAANGQLDTAGRFIVAVVWSAIAIGLHFAARATLGELT